MPGIVLALVPAFRAELERFVVTFLVLLDEPFEADVAADFEAGVIARFQEQQPKDTQKPLPSRNGWMQRKSRFNAASTISG